MTDARKPCQVSDDRPLEEWCHEHERMEYECVISALEAANGLMREALKKTKTDLWRISDDSNIYLNSELETIDKALSTPQHKALDEVRATKEPRYCDGVCPDCGRHE